jgi:hypothetical protein
MDNVSSHKTQAIRNCFTKQLRWHVRGTPKKALAYENKPCTYSPYRGDA